MQQRVFTWLGKMNTTPGRSAVLVFVFCMIGWRIVGHLLLMMLDHPDEQNNRTKLLFLLFVGGFVAISSSLFAGFIEYRLQIRQEAARLNKKPTGAPSDGG
jgi:hypothetical protein